MAIRNDACSAVRAISDGRWVHIGHAGDRPATPVRFLPAAFGAEIPEIMRSPRSFGAFGAASRASGHGEGGDRMGDDGPPRRDRRNNGICIASPPRFGLTRLISAALVRPHASRT